MILKRKQQNILTRTSKYYLWAISRDNIFFIAYTENVFVVRVFINTLRPRQDGRHFADDNFARIFVNENWCNLIKFSLKYVGKGPIDNNRALVQIMAWRRSGDKPLSEPMMVRLPTHICVTRPQWVNEQQGSVVLLDSARVSHSFCFRDIVVIISSTLTVQNADVFVFFRW